jgi:hypothetical protein
VNTDNTVNIKLIKESWNRKEVSKIIHDCMVCANSKEVGRLQGFIDKWIEENL